MTTPIALPALLLTALVALPSAAAMPPGSDLLRTTLDPDQILVADDGAGDDGFSMATSASGTTIVVGAPNADVGDQTNQGAAYVYQISQGVWQQTQKLLAEDGQADMSFGYQVAIDGDHLLVAASFATINDNMGQGAVYAFRYVDGQWHQQQKLVASDGAMFNEFGTRMTLRDDTAFIASPRANVEGMPGRGAVYVFRHLDGAWQQTQKLQASNGDFFNFFGYSLALGDGQALIGAPSVEVNGVERMGSAYAFAETDGVWEETQILVPDDGQTNHEFGYSAALSGATAVIGAHFASVGLHERQGSAYVYHFENGSWQATEKLTHGLPGMGHEFSAAIAFMGADLAIAAPGLQHVYLYRKHDGSWQQAAELASEDILFGFNLTAIPGGLLIAAPSADVGPHIGQGRAHLYRSGTIFANGFESTD